MPSSESPKTINLLPRAPDTDALLQAFDGFIYICSQDYRIQYMNDKLLERTGYDATGEYCYKVLHDFEKVCPWCKNDTLFSEQKSVRWQIKSPKDERWYDIINTPIHNADGTLSQQFLIMDITESYLAKEELSLMQTLINQSNDAIFVVDAETSALLYVNDKACSNLGYTTEELLALQVIDIATHIVDIPDWQRYVARIREQNNLFESEQIRKDGSRIPVEINARFVSRHGQNFLVTVVRDISERKDQRRVLFDEKNKLEALLATLTDGITVQDLDFKVLYQNKVHTDKQGVHTGEYCYQAYQHRATICDGCLLVQSLADGKVHRRETTATTKNGTAYLEVTSSPMRDADGNIIAGLESVRDITVQKKMEEQLNQAQKMEAIGTLAGGIAHDFNNILSGILGFSELARYEYLENSKAKNYINHVIESSKRAADLVKQILLFSRKADQKKRPLQPHFIVKEALKLLRATLPATITIEERIDSTCGFILADPTNIHQIVMNLCTNAFHAIENEKGSLTVNLCRKELRNEDIVDSDVSPGPFIELSIKDTGRGMDKQTIKKVFEPYFTTKEVGHGTGLGLAVVHGIVNSLNGFIKVESEPGKGTTFHIYIPAVEEIVDTPVDTEQKNIPRGTERILVIDDESIIVNLSTTILEGLGYTVTATTNSLEALEKVRANADDFDLIVTDQTMPNLSGVEMAQEILKIKPAMPIILCSGYSAVISEEGALALGIKKYLAKPVEWTKLAQIVREVLDENE